MNRTRVLITDMPALAVDVVTRIVEQQDDMTLVGTPLDADVVLLGSLTGSVAILGRFPSLRLIELDAIGGRDWFLELRRCGTSSPGWPQRLVDAIRRDGS